MENYFETADCMEAYDKLSDYEKGYLDGIYAISNNIEEEHRPFITDTLAEYIEQYIAENKDCPPPCCDSLEECAEIFTYDFLIYYEEIAVDLLTNDYIITIADFLGIKLPNDPEEIGHSEEYKELKSKYAAGIQFYMSSQTKLHRLLNEYQNGIIAAYTSILSELDMSIRTHLECDEEGAIEEIQMQILDVLEGNVNIPLSENTPVFLPVLEEVYRIFLSNDIMECCIDHVLEKFRDEYIFYISEFTGIEYTEVYETVIE